MAKRKRLTPANPMFLGAPEEPRNEAPKRAPIADVAADSSASAALAEVAGELSRAREGGRMVRALPLDQIELGYLVRDRIWVDDEEMAALIASIRDRGQQTPIEVVALPAGGYGLISGWRRCQALMRLQQEGVGDGMVLALERRPESASDAYRAMVEENEIRAGLSYFERARIVEVAVAQGVFESRKQALQTLFAAASRAKRSKIGSFVTLVDALGETLRYPQAIGERLGLRLAKQIEQAPAAAETIAMACDAAPRNTAEEELAVLTRWVGDAEASEAATSAPAPQVKKSPAPRPMTSQPRPGLEVRFHPEKNRLELSGVGLTEELHAALLRWIAQEA